MAACRITMTKRCSKCRAVKPLSEFTLQQASKSWHKRHCRCKECNRLRQHEYREAYAAEVLREEPWKKWRYASKASYLRAHDSRFKLLRQYGLSLDAYFDLLEQHKGKCAICGREPPSDKNLAVDHCHATGNVRGLLCSDCNLGIGQLGDTVEALERAIAYLRAA